MKDKEYQRLALILEAMEDGIYIVREDFTVEFMNQAMVRDFGEALGKKCHQALHSLARPCPWCRAEQVFGGETVRRELYVRRVDKTYKLIELPLVNRDGTLSKLAIQRDITTRKRREAELRASEEEYKSLFEHVACGVFISSKEGKFLDANPALLKMLGYESKEEFLQIDITRDLYVRPEDRREFQQIIQENGQVIDYEVEFKRKDGVPIPVTLTAHARYDAQGGVVGYEGINVDQSQRKRMERQLTEAHDFLNKIIQSSPNAIIATDLKGDIIIWNRAAEETLDYTAEEVLGKMNIERIYQPDMAKKVMQLMRSPEYGEKGRLHSFPMVHVRRDGQIVEGNLSAAIIYDTKGKEAATVGIFVDLKDRLEMERKLRETQEQLLQSEKLAAMGRLTSQIAHELNNPLYGIMNTLELLKSEIPPQSKRRRILEMALSETVRLTDLLRKMLSFSKPDQEERQLTDINAILEEILLLHEKQLRENSIRMITSLQPDLGKVWVSRNQLRQVFLNMISNARDAMPEGGTLHVATRGDARVVEIEFSDTGTGIKEEDRHRVFEAFFTTKDSIKGVGLGLSVCYGFIRDHGGDIRVESEWGEGTTFLITLPVYKGPRLE